MRHILSTATIMTIGAAVATTAATALASGPTPAAAGPPCRPKITKIGGHQAAVYCGPATATLHLSGKTFTFRNGLCMTSKSAPLTLDLGTTVVGVKGNAGKPDFAMLIAHFHTAFGSGSVFGADYGGKSLFPNGQTLIEARGHIPAKGTFTSTVTFGAKFTGSWSCHGVVWRHGG